LIQLNSFTISRKCYNIYSIVSGNFSCSLHSILLTGLYDAQ